ncbi:hypothetical protein HORIV_58920 [Vreelandella olivaria]|uniref:Uncharacterized protein n=1 Tax=Vreelandella olivaria TaxID=390919 RepID=A0ABM7GRN2_9GAMM|nr:hypothetical protein HORIV_58920 [Halomonas olivaria]
MKAPWSDPVYLNSSGFDPSLFHDDDGRKWLINLQWDYRQREGRDRFGGIVLQEYDVELRRLVGDITTIFTGTELKLTEGPHLYRRDGWYHLLVAEGGTGYQHAVTMARSKTLTGPYEVHPQNPLLTASHDPDHPLQRAGHADLVDSPEGDTYLVHLCGRPLPGTRLSPLGRETAIQRVAWGSDGWLRLDHGGNTPALKVAMSGVTQKPPAPEEHYDFATDTLPAAFQWLRTPYPDRLFSLTERPGYLRLFGRESVGSWFEQALVARRQDNIHCSAETTLEFEPEDIQQFAGLIAYYNRFKFHYLAVTLNDAGDKVLSVISCLDDWPNGNLKIADVSVRPWRHDSARAGYPRPGAVLSLCPRWRGVAADRPRAGRWPALRRRQRSCPRLLYRHLLGMAAHDISGRGTPPISRRSAIAAPLFQRRDKLMAEVTLRDIEKTFHGKATVIPDLNLHIEDGSFTVLVGPSGCGKSTLLRMIAGLETVTQGTITIGGEDVTTAEPSDRDIAMVFQSYALYPHMTVARNIDFGMRLAKVPAKEREAKVAEAARLLNLEDLLERKPAELSGGQRQRWR